MKIGHVQRFSLIDYPGKICAIVFTQGCNFRCPYCHNPELVIPEQFGEPVPEDVLFSFLEKRGGKLDAVSITGGEPTLQPGVIDFISSIKELGFLVKIDTNGSFPNVIEELLRLHLLDYIAMDIKAPLRKYRAVTSSTVNTHDILTSINLIKNSGTGHEFRTTVVESLLGPRDILNIAKHISGADRYVLQRFVPSKAVNPAFLTEGTLSDALFEKLRKDLAPLFRSVILR